MLCRAWRPRSRAEAAAHVRTPHAATATMTAAAAIVRRSTGVHLVSEIATRGRRAGRAATPLRTVESPPGAQTCQSGAGPPAEPQEVGADPPCVEALRVEGL